MFFITCEADLQFSWETFPIQGLYFYRSDMPFHAKLIHIINQLQFQYKQVTFHAIDTDQFIGSCIRFNITCVPTLVVLKNAKEISRLEGTVKTKDFTIIFNDICTL